jgi:hypothetical protein
MITVTFAPQDTVQYDEILTIQNNDELVEVVLQGEGLPVSTISVEESSKLPTEFALSAPYPNPFNPTATITFDIPSAGNIRLSIHNILGRHIETLIDQTMSPGTHKITWNADHLPSGIYFCHMTAPNFHQVRRMVLIK